MVGEQEGQTQESEERHPPKRRSVIVRIFGAFKRYENRRRKTQHQTNELMMARWTCVVGLFTGALVLVGIVTAVIFWRQFNVMQGQMDVTIVQLKPKLSFELKTAGPCPRSTNNEDTLITPVWTNHGTTEAIDFQGWHQQRYFHAYPVDAYNY